MTTYYAVMIAEGAAEAPDEETYLAAWQQLVDTGLAWELPCFFGRTAQRLIDEGHIWRRR